VSAARPASSRIELLTPAPSPEEAAAIVAALERFMRATAPAPAPGKPPGGWTLAAILEGVEREPQGAETHPWINT
jgi:hypothetical protein